MDTSLLPPEVQASVRSIERHIRTARRALDRKDWTTAVRSIERARDELNNVPEQSEVRAHLSIVLGDMLREVMGLPPAQQPAPEKPRPTRPEASTPVSPTVPVPEAASASVWRDNPFYALPEGTSVPQVRTAGWVAMGGAALFLLREGARKNPGTGARIAYKGKGLDVEASFDFADYVASGLLAVGVLGTFLPEISTTLVGFPLMVAGGAYFGVKVVAPDQLTSAKKLIGMD